MTEAVAEGRLTGSALVLESHLGGAWRAGAGRAQPLVDPVTGETVAWADSSGLDLGAAVAYARTVGGPALKALSFAERAALIGATADVLAARRDDWYEISRRNSGNTRADAAIDVDGAIGTLKYFAKTGAALGDKTLLADGASVRLSRDPAFQGRHIGAPIRGVAVHINAYNFPAWGLWGKAAMALLAGVPVLAKPATATAWLAEAMVRAVADAGVLPPGALSLLTGSPGDLLDHLAFGDAVAFTGSAETGAAIRSHPRVASQGVRVNIEADSLNSALLGPGVGPGSPAFDLFVAEVVKEMTAKAGQKCTAIRRVFAPAEQADAVVAAIAEQLAAVKVGDPADPQVGMGPVVSASQRKAVEDGVRRLSASARVVTPVQIDLIGADWTRGAFVAPTLLQVAAGVDVDVVHEIEVFGPVATVVGYGSTDEAFALARRGGGSLAASVFGEDTGFLALAAAELSDSHGRLLLVDPSIGASHTGHGIVLPSLLHGGPGRAGGGAELGGLRGLWFYHQLTAIQASTATLAEIETRLVDPAAL